MTVKCALLSFIVLLSLVVVIIGEMSPGSRSIVKCFQYNNLKRTKHNLGYVKRLKRSTVYLDSRLYLGKDAEGGQLPFMAALGFKKYNQINYVCGGTLISDRFVLTAAHCIYAKNWGEVMYVRLGDLNLAVKIDDVRVQEFRVRKHFVHPKYASRFKYNDIALIMLDKPATFCQQVAPACLDTGGKTLTGFEFYVAGWGATGYGQSLSDHLQVGLMQEFNRTICQTAYPRDFSLPYGLNDESQICAGGISGFSDTCEGDSGGPLVYSYTLPEKTLYFHVGIISFGKPCSTEYIPSVYTRVSYYLEWIENITWSNERVEPEQVGLLYHTSRSLVNSADYVNCGSISLIFIFLFLYL